MLRLAITSGRGRLGTFSGALIALLAGSVIAMAWGMQLESMLRIHSPEERYAGSAAVVAAQQNVGADNDVILTTVSPNSGVLRSPSRTQSISQN